MRFYFIFGFALRTCVIATMLFGMSCSYLYGSTVTVSNQSSETLMNIKVTMAGESVWTGALTPGQSHKVSGRPQKDGTIGISFEAAGQKVTREFGYVTPGLREDHSVTVSPSLDVKYTSQ